MECTCPRILLSPGFYSNTTVVRPVAVGPAAGAGVLLRAASFEVRLALVLFAVRSTGAGRGGSHW